MLRAGNMSLIFSQGISTYILALRVILISTTILSAAIALKFSVPAVGDFAVSNAPSIYNRLISWFKPPYLYLIINCIIISIVASSKFQSKSVDSQSSPSIINQLEIMTPIPDLVQVNTPIFSPIKHCSYDDFVVSSVEIEAVRLEPEDFRFNSDSVNNEVNYKETTIWSNGKDEELIETIAADSPSTKAEMSNSFNDSVSPSKSSWSPPAMMKRDSSEFINSNEKPLVSARFGHRRFVKASPEGWLS